MHVHGCPFNTRCGRRCVVNIFRRAINEYVIQLMHKFLSKTSVTAHYNTLKSEIGPFYRIIFLSWIKLLLRHSIFHIIGELSPTFDKIFAKNKMHLLFKRKTYSTSNINFRIAFTNCDCTPNKLWSDGRSKESNNIEYAFTWSVTKTIY